MRNTNDRSKLNITMSASDIFENDDLVAQCTLAPALVEALLECTAVFDAASIEPFQTLVTTNNLHFWDNKT